MQSTSPESLVSITRAAFDSLPWYGMLVQESELYVVVQHVSDRYDFDGYRAFRREDITAMEHTFKRKSFIDQALRVKGLKPTAPNLLELSSMRRLMESAQQLFGVLVVNREALNQDEVEVGTVRMASENTYVLRSLSPDAEWENDDRPFRYQDITMIEFGGEHERTLLMVANARAARA